MCLRGVEEMQPWDMRLAIPHHPRDSGSAGEPPGDYLRSDGKFVPLQTAEQPALNSWGVISFLCRAGYEQQEEQEQSRGFELGQAGLN